MSQQYQTEKTTFGELCKEFFIVIFMLPMAIIAGVIVLAASIFKGLFSFVTFLSQPEDHNYYAPSVDVGANYTRKWKKKSEKEQNEEK